MQTMLRDRLVGVSVMKRCKGDCSLKPTIAEKVALERETALANPLFD